MHHLCLVGMKCEIDNGGRFTNMILLNSTGPKTLSWIFMCVGKKTKKTIITWELLICFANCFRPHSFLAALCRFEDCVWLFNLEFLSIGFPGIAKQLLLWYRFWRVEGFLLQRLAWQEILISTFMSIVVIAIYLFWICKNGFWWSLKPYLRCYLLLATILFFLNSNGYLILSFFCCMIIAFCLSVRNSWLFFRTPILF